MSRRNKLRKQQNKQLAAEILDSLYAKKHTNREIMSALSMDDPHSERSVVMYELQYVHESLNSDIIKLIGSFFSETARCVDIDDCSCSADFEDRTEKSQSDKPVFDQTTKSDRLKLERELLAAEPEYISPI